ncbi:DHHC palmitoyltransferase-domain-containing protein [Cokeromyces recurvatus]|uniref:DHHC palmitoyltransferase-domain-containing protein n=1 Tax=Cokeromyces recurvatus TaxID=90255 RepID=UPI00221F8195|nr:DHHC palmitoyltransferase-domain-containing protein [Cokeromyces recurvatus]KAI7903355.1 DHHC palmitoyltransferase-domain-containing protein [Cokeromyces recurvatus]
MNQRGLAIAYFVPFNVFFFFFIISYCRIVTQKPGYPPSTVLNKEDRDVSSSLGEKDLQKKPDTILGDPKWCNTCQIWKPDRAHHCSVCDACVLRMDQVNGCVGFANYRYYIQFLCYVTILATWTFCTSLAAFIHFHGLVISYTCI